MAIFHCEHRSTVLDQNICFNVILPEKAKTMIGMEANGEGTYKTLYLFHGL